MINYFTPFLKILIPAAWMLWFLSGHSAYSQQTGCAFTLQEAENYYEMGMLDTIPSMLRSCINSDGFDDEELSRAYKLLILTYLFEDYQEMADLTTLKFLEKFPEYTVKPTDPIEFSYLLNTYKTIPTFSMGITGGLNYSFIRIMEPYSMNGDGDYTGKYSASGFNFQVGVLLKKYINENLDVNLKILYATAGFDYEMDQLDYKISYLEKQSMISCPLTISYNFLFGKIKPFVQAGINFDYKFDIIADFSKEYTGNFVSENLKDSDLDILQDRKPFNLSAILGGGVSYDIKKGSLLLDVRYQLGFLNVVNTENRYDDFKWSNYNYIDDDFAMNNLFISVGYIYPFYKTVKTDQ
jgi:hypothetical protein